MSVHYIIRIYFQFTWRLCAHVFSISKTLKTKLINPAIERPDFGDIISAKLIKKKMPITFKRNTNSKRLFKKSYEFTFHAYWKHIKGYISARNVIFHCFIFFLNFNYLKFQVNKSHL